MLTCGAGFHASTLGFVFSCHSRSRRSAALTLSNSICQEFNRTAHGAAFSRAFGAAVSRKHGAIRRFCRENGAAFGRAFGAAHGAAVSCEHGAAFGLALWREHGGAFSRAAFGPVVGPAVGPAVGLAVGPAVGLGGNWMKRCIVADLRQRYLSHPEPCNICAPLCSQYTPDSHYFSSQVIMRRGAAVAFEKAESSCTFACVLLDNKHLNVLTYDVTPISDEVRDWALCPNRTLSTRVHNLPTLNSHQIKEKIAAEIKGVDLFFIRDKETLDLLTNIFCIDKSNIHIIQRQLTPSINLFCAPCGEDLNLENCSIDKVVCIANLLCNLRPDHLPSNLKIAPAAHPFTFPASVSRFAISAALPTADISRCLHFNALYDSEPDSD